MRELNIKIYKKNTGHHVVCYIHPQTRKRKRKKFPTVKAAKDYKKQLEREFQLGGIYVFNEMSVMELMKRHIEKCPRTRIKVRRNSFISFCETFGSFPINELDRHQLSQWFEGIKKKNNYSDRTLKRIKSQLNHFFKFLVDENIIPVSPLSQIKFDNNPKPKRQRVVLSIEEVKTILANARKFDIKWFYPYICTLAHAGPRCGEALELERSDVDFPMNLLHFRKTKNGNARSVHMSEELKAALKEHINSHKLEVAFAKEDPVNRWMVRRALERFKREFPIEPINKNWTYHSLRHSFAYNFLKKGGNMYQLQAILGHKTIGMTIDLYGQIGAQDIANPSPYGE